jgi:hypothetical protein
MPGADLDDRLDRLLRTVQDGVTAGDPAVVVRRGRRRRLARRTAGVGAVAVLLAAVVVVAALLPEDREPVSPAGGVVRVPQKGFELPVPAGWTVQRQLTGPGSQVVGVVLVPRSGQPPGAAITVAAHDDQEMTEEQVRGYVLDLQVDASRRADGRPYKLRPGRAGRLASGTGPVGPYVIAWPAWPPSCWPLPAPAEQPPACAAWRVLLVTGAAAPGDAAGVQQVLRVMHGIVVTVRPIGNAVDPPRPRTTPPPEVPAVSPPTKVPAVPPLTTAVPPNTRLLLGKGGSGRGAWEAWITPIQGSDSAGFMMRFPRATPKPWWHWEQLEPQIIQRDGVYTLMDCLSWLPGSGLVLSGLAREDAASVRIELAGQAPVLAATFGRDKPVPWVAFVSPSLPAGAKLDRVVALDAAGKEIGIQRPFEGTLCRP